MTPASPNPNRREFVQAGVTALASAGLLGAAAPPQSRTNSGGIPLRPLGRTGVDVPILCLGGYHSTTHKDAKESIALIQRAVDEGITFLDNCWDYHDGGAEERMGEALAAGGRRDKVFLMTKVCTHGRGAGLALKMLDQSLRRLQTDHLDLWQVHDMGFDNDPELAYTKGGVLEALDEAKKQGKVRFLSIIQM